MCRVVGIMLQQYTDSKLYHHINNTLYYSEIESAQLEKNNVECVVNII